MNRRVIAVVVAVVLALAGTAAVSVYVRNADSRALAGQQTVEVYVAQKLVPAGTSLHDAVDNSLITLELVSAKGVPAGSLTAAHSGDESSVAVSDIQPGELVLDSRFGAQAASTSALPVPDGMMAVSLALQDPAHVGSFVTPGSKIAIFDTFNVLGMVAGKAVPSGDHLTDDFKKNRATRILLPKVEVLAVGATSTSSSSTATQSGDQTNGTPSTGNQTAQSTLFTVAVDQAQAEALVHAIQTGTLYFALLADSSTVTPDAGVNDLTLFNVK
jgi:pilus assembly protein CpaB